MCIWTSWAKRKDLKIWKCFSFSVISTFRQIFQPYLRTNALVCCLEQTGLIKETLMIYMMKFLCLIWRIALCPMLELGERQLHIHFFVPCDQTLYQFNRNTLLLLDESAVGKYLDLNPNRYSNPLDKYSYFYKGATYRPNKFLKLIKTNSNLRFGFSILDFSH